MKKLFVIIGTFIIFFSGLRIVNARTYEIAVISSGNIKTYDTVLAGFLAALKEKGFDPNITMYNITDNKNENHKINDRIKSDRPDLVLTIASGATELVKGEITDIPVVFTMVFNPLKRNLTARNMTGASIDIPIETQFAYLKKTVVKIRRIGVLYNGGTSADTIAEARKAAAKMGLELEAVEVGGQDEFPGALDKVGKTSDALWMVLDSNTYTAQSLKHTILNTLRNRLPFMAVSPSYVKSGALLAVYCDYEDIGRQSGESAARIFRGEKPADIPVSVPRKVLLALNLNTARNIGITIPGGTLKAADVVYR
jgi:putative tryptophan/tyrosine transport system substrate-binding protein